MELTLRTELMPDYDTVSALYEKSTGEKMPAEYVENLRKSPQFIPELSIIAENEEKELIGHIVFTPVVIRSTNQNFPSLVLSAIALNAGYNTPSYKAELIRKGMEVCYELGFSSVIVSGYTDFYAELGFKPADQWNIQSSENVENDEFMAIELRRNALKTVNGIVEYPDGFLAA